VLVGSTDLNYFGHFDSKLHAAADLACFSHAESEELKEADFDF
jgi:hypothetical protein